MSKISVTKKLERAVILILNGFDDWDLKPTEDEFSCYDAIGITPKGRKCVVEFKFRKKYYETKMLEVKKYNCIMKMPDDYVKLYFVADPEGTYIFWLDGLKEFKSIKKYGPKTTYWNDKKQEKDVYLLPEELASYKFKIDN